MINEFRGKYYFLSNFYEAPVTWNGITYQNNEAAFQSAKVTDDKIRATFSQNEDLKEKLLDTGNEHLEEGNTWGDKIWGTVNGKGQNNLGKILMMVREELRKE